jgi:hypothetical protein
MGTNPSGVARLTEAEGVEHPHQVFASRGAEAKITRVGRATLVLLPECFIDTCPNPLGPLEWAEPGCIVDVLWPADTGAMHGPSVQSVRR